MITEREKTIELFRPITYKGNELHEITLRPPTIGALRQAQGHTRNGRTDEAQTKFGISIVSKCAGLDDASIEMLDGDTFLEALTWVSSFLGDDKTSSKEEST